MPVRPINFDNMNKEIHVVKEKDSIRNVIKIIRLFSKDFKTNQFETSCILNHQFNTIITIALNFISKNNLEKEFVIFCSSLTNELDIILKNRMEFNKQLCEKSIDYFGI